MSVCGVGEVFFEAEGQTWPALSIMLSNAGAATNIPDAALRGKHGVGAVYGLSPGVLVPSHPMEQREILPPIWSMECPAEKDRLDLWPTSTEKDPKKVSLSAEPSDVKKSCNQAKEPKNGPDPG